MAGLQGCLVAPFFAWQGDDGSWDLPLGFGLPIGEHAGEQRIGEARSMLKGNVIAAAMRAAAAVFRDAEKLVYAMPFR